MKINNQTIVKRWNSVMSSIYREHLTIDTDLSELEYQKKNYNIENGISVKWLLNKAEYVLSTYYEEGHLNNDMSMISRQMSDGFNSQERKFLLYF